MQHSINWQAVVSRAACFASLKGRKLYGVMPAHTGIPLELFDEIPAFVGRTEKTVKVAAEACAGTMIKRSCLDREV